MESGLVSFQVMHQATSSSDAACEWLRRHQANLPTHARPDDDDWMALANLLVSYFATSFTLTATPSTRVIPKMCCCGWCSTIISVNHLVARTPQKKDFQTAAQLCDLFVESLAAEDGVSLTTKRRQLLSENSSLAFEVSHLAYVRELLRRTEFASQGTGVLALWRTIAWKNNNPTPDYHLTTDRVLESQAIVRSVMTSQFIEEH